MKFIQKFIRKFIRKELPIPLGRWNIDYCNHLLDKKVDLSNEDHCGPCGQYNITKISENNISENNISENNISENNSEDNSQKDVKTPERLYYPPNNGLYQLLNDKVTR